MLLNSTLRGLQATSQVQKILNLGVHKDTLKTLDEPVGPTAIEMLRYMHDS